MTGYPLPLDTQPMEAKLAPTLPGAAGWQFEPKWDGFRCLAYKAGPDVDLRAKSGKPLARYFPEMIEALAQAPQHSFVLDGELVIEGHTFASLQDRIHPAPSRIKRLAAETPATLVLFDCLHTPGTGSLLDAPLATRRHVLEHLAPIPRSRLSPATTCAAEAQAWLAPSRGALDGVVAKRLDGPYTPGKRTMVKVKRIRSADCVIGGYRIAKGTDQVGSLLLGLYDGQGRLDHVGFTAAIAHADRPALTARLRALEPGEGFTGNAPGGPSRWATDSSADWRPIRPELVVEVAFDQVTDGRFRHGTTLLRWRPDKRPGQCTRDQLADA